MRERKPPPHTLTKSSIAGLIPVTEPGVRGPPSRLLARVQGTGLGDGGDQVLVVGVAPAPPADLWLAAAGDHGPVAQVPAREEGARL